MRDFPGVPDRSPIARAPARVGARAAFHVRHAGGPAAAGPRFFVLCGHGQARSEAARKDAGRRPRYGHPSEARARTWVARLAVARSAIHVRSKGPEPKARGGRASGQGCRLCRPRPRQRACQPPLCPLTSRGRFFIFRVENFALSRRSWLSDGPLVAFLVGHRWATWPTYPWNT